MIRKFTDSLSIKWDGEHCCIIQTLFEKTEIVSLRAHEVAEILYFLEEQKAIDTMDAWVDTTAKRLHNLQGKLNQICEDDGN